MHLIEDDVTTYKDASLSGQVNGRQIMVLMNYHGFISRFEITIGDP
jgi:hypothetical protein